MFINQRIYIVQCESLCSRHYFNRKPIKLSLRRFTHFFHFTRISRMEVRVGRGRWPAAQSNPLNLHLSFCRVISLKNRCYWGAQCSFWHNVQDTRWERKRKLAHEDTLLFSLFQMFIWQTKIYSHSCWTIYIVLENIWR